MRSNPTYDRSVPYELPPVPPTPDSSRPRPGSVDSSVMLQPLVQLVDALKALMAELNSILLPAINASPAIRERATLQRDRNVQMVLALARPSLVPVFQNAASHGSLELTKLNGLLRSKGLLAEIGLAEGVYTTLLDESGAPMRALPAVPADDIKWTFERCVVPDVDGTSKIGYEGFEECVFRLGELRYGTVTHMSVKDRTAALCQNLIGVLSPTEAMTSEGGAAQRFLRARASSDRFGAESFRLPHESAADLNLWGKCWAALDLTKVADFPACQAPIHEALHQSFHLVRAVYAAYSVRGQGMGEDGWRHVLEDIGMGDGKGVATLFRRLVASSAANSLVADVAPGGGKPEAPMIMSLPRFLEGLIWLTVLRIKADGQTATPVVLGKRLTSLLVDALLPSARADPLTAPMFQVLGDKLTRAKLSARLPAVRAHVFAKTVAKPNGFGGNPRLLVADAQPLLRPLLCARQRLPVRSDVTGDPAAEDLIAVGLSETEAASCLQAVFDANYFDVEGEKEKAEAQAREAEEKFKQKGGVGAAAERARTSVRLLAAERAAKTSTAGSEPAIDINQLADVVALCGHVLFVNVEQMSAADRANAALNVLLDGSSVEEEVARVTAIRFYRKPMNFTAMAELKETSAQVKMWQRIWEGVNLAPAQARATAAAAKLPLPRLPPPSPPLPSPPLSYNTDSTALPLRLTPPLPRRASRCGRGASTRRSACRGSRCLTSSPPTATRAPRHPSSARSRSSASSRSSTTAVPPRLIRACRPPPPPSAPSA